MHLPEGAHAHLLASRSADLVVGAGGVLCLGKPVFRLPLDVATAGGVVLRAPVLGDFPAGIGHAVAPGPPAEPGSSIQGEPAPKRRWISPR